LTPLLNTTKGEKKRCGGTSIGRNKTHTTVKGTERVKAHPAPVQQENENGRGEREKGQHPIRIPREEEKLFTKRGWGKTHKKSEQETNNKENKGGQHPAKQNKKKNALHKKRAMVRVATEISRTTR